MKFSKPNTTIIMQSKNQTQCESWKSYTNPFISFLYWKRLETTYNYLKNKKWDLILEIGCGYGFFLPSLCQISKKVIGSDIDSMFDFLYRVTLNDIEKSCGNLVLMEADVRHLSKYIQVKCDVIIALSVLEHIDNIDKTLKEISSCLKPNGLFLCVLPTENWLYKIGRKILGYQGEYHSHYNYRELRTNIDCFFFEEKTWFIPFNIPIFFVGVYRSRTKQLL